MTISKNKGLTSFYLSHLLDVLMVPILDEEHAIGQALPLSVLKFCSKLHVLLLPYLTPTLNDVHIHLTFNLFWYDCGHTKNYLI